ncbi:amino acid adenylation domain-containing protein [Clostridium bornimense]|uniref:amino acid adenylation domain-containing protein n=1 Tax=Clostridium bornimense TaxID=1216932 RepID=UPI001C0F93C8|nr:amino acid adenylation domain-containing protein [Clostridium bornimense]MBU5317324.1 amino acid adenylation domain-containing protein [Clostridium bornimense]
MCNNVKIINFENEFMSFPLPYDSLNDRSGEYETELLDLKKSTKSKLKLISNFYILLYRYCYKTAFSMTIINEQTNAQFYINNENATYEIIESEINNNINNSENNVCDKGVKVLVVVNKDLEEYENEFLNAVIILNIKYSNEEVVNSEILYRKSLFKKSTIERMKENLYYLIEQTNKDKLTNINMYDVVSISEKQALNQFNYKDKNWNTHETYMDYFYNHVDEYGDKDALVEGNTKLNYKQLNNISNYYAKSIFETKSDYIGIYFKSDIATAIGILSILKAGKIIVAINPTYPPKRVSYIVKSLKISTILTCDETFNVIKDNNIVEEVILINLDSRLNQSYENIHNVVDVKDLCYIIFTSGTTGEPKGVKIMHENIMIELNFFRDYFNIDTSLRALHILNYSFDFGLYDILSSILYGGCLYSIDNKKMKSFKDYIIFINDNNINFINTTPSFFNILSSFKIKLPSLKHVHLGGEKVTYQMVHNYVKIVDKSCNIYNGYGPCECTVGSNIYNIPESEKYSSDNDLISVPIGSPTDNSLIYVMDDNLMDVPINALGELFISGESLGLGYIDEKRNEGKFINVPKKQNKRMYRTGDLVRWLPSGDIEFIGRIDNQVKINGFRIELSEIDSILTRNKDIIDAKTVSKNVNGNNILISYILTTGDIDCTCIKEYLMKYVPYYMVPTKIVKVREFPYLASGKIDVEKLRYIQ